jgi:hypothetical protein
MAATLTGISTILGAIVSHKIFHTMFSLIKNGAFSLKKESNQALLWIALGSSIGLTGYCFCAFMITTNNDTESSFFQDTGKQITTTFIIGGSLIAPLQIVSVWIRIGIQASGTKKNNKNQALKVFVKTFQVILFVCWLFGIILKSSTILRFLVVGAAIVTATTFHFGGKHIVGMLHPGEKLSAQSDDAYFRAVEPSLVIENCCATVRNAMLGICVLQVASSPFVTYDDYNKSALGTALFMVSVCYAIFMNYIILEYLRYGSRKALGMEFKGIKGLKSTKVSLESTVTVETSEENSKGLTAGENAVLAEFGRGSAENET